MDNIFTVKGMCTHMYIEIKHLWKDSLEIGIIGSFEENMWKGHMIFIIYSKYFRKDCITIL